MTNKTLLITGGTGYIGSHTVITLEQAGYKTIIIDNLSNSSQNSLDGIEKILGYRPDFFHGDIRDRDFLVSIFEKYSFDGVIHFAGLKAVGESCEQPLLYHRNNVGGSMILFEVMEQYGVRNIVFSSSATVYDAINAPEYIEGQRLGTTNPYGSTKLIIERLLEDLATYAEWSVTALRYFNPIGAHPSGYIGESPAGIPNNLLPYVLDVAIGKREFVRVFGADYDTPDGTGVRDYIDVCDLAEAHLSAYDKNTGGFRAINIGTGKGVSVIEIIHTVEAVTKKKIPYQILPRREGDIAEFYANTELAKSLLDWSSKRDICTSIESGWRYVGGDM